MENSPLKELSENQKQTKQSVKTTHKPPIFEKIGSKWMIQNQRNMSDLCVRGTDMNNGVYIFNCTNCKLTVDGKINWITLDKCNKVLVVFDTLISGFEFINCSSCKMQVTGKVNTITVNNTDGCEMYLNHDSLDVVIISSKSVGVNVLVTDGIGGYVEHAVPEQFRSVITEDKGLITVPNPV